MKTLKDTVSNMLSDDWKERLIAEIEQLDIRIYQLEKYMKEIGENHPEYPFLKEQNKYMAKYMGSLIARASLAKIDYKFPSVEERLKSPSDNVPLSDELWTCLLFYLCYSGFWEKGNLNKINNFSNID